MPTLSFGLFALSKKVCVTGPAIGPLVLLLSEPVRISIVGGAANTA